MKRNLRFALRVFVILFSVSLLIASVWHAEEQAQPSVFMSSSKTMTVAVPTMMSGSKTFNGVILNRIDGQILQAPPKP